MKTLLGKEGMQKIKKVASDLRRSKASGMISPKERKEQLDREAKQEMKEKQKSSKPSKKNKESEITGFDLDSVLSSSPSQGKTSEFGSGSSSVVATKESIEVDQQKESIDYKTQDYSYQEEAESVWTPPKKQDRTERRSSNVVSSEPVKPKREHFSSVAKNTTNSPPVVKKKKTVRKRKSVKSAPAEPTPEQESKKSSFESNDDFSDFSL
jgi:hypothetical protein